MRLYLKLTPNKEPVPFNYQQSLVGTFHKWLGQNELHDDISLYSLSWLTQARIRKGGFDFPEGSTFFVSSWNDELLAAMVKGVFRGHEIRWGMEVREVTIRTTPEMGEKQRFVAQSPILIKRMIEGEKHAQYFFPGDEKSDQYLTETLMRKIEKAGLNGEASVRFDPDYPHPKTKKIRFNGIDIRASMCPVIVEGDPRAVQFAWEVGVGNSTGIGFGGLR